MEPPCEEEQVRELEALARLGAPLVAFYRNTQRNICVAVEETPESYRVVLGSGCSVELVDRILGRMAVWRSLWYGSRRVQMCPGDRIVRQLDGRQLDSTFTWWVVAGPVDG